MRNWVSATKLQKDFERNWIEIQKEFEELGGFVADADNSKERIAQGENDIWAFARTYFPEYVREGSADFHGQWGAIAAIENEPVIIEAFRGAGKSTFFSLIDPLHKIVYGKYHYFLFSSYNEDKSGVFSGRILLELLFNERLKHDFGSFFADDKKPSIYSFIIPKNKVRKQRIKVEAISIGQDPRGLVFGSRRPDFVRLDDIQTMKRSKSKKWVKESVDWILTSLIPALEVPFNLKIMATKMHTKDVVSILENGSDDRKKVPSFRFPVMDERGNSLWASKFSIGRIEMLKETVGRLNFMQEFMLIPKKEDEAVFKRETMKIISLGELNALDFEYTLSASDVGGKTLGGASGEKKDYKAVIALGHAQGRDYVIGCHVKKENPLDLICGMYELYDNIRPKLTYMYWEDNGQQSLLDDTFDFVAQKEGYALPLKPLHNSANKQLRIEQGLSAVVENGNLIFCAEIGDTKLLLEMLEDFPEGNDDGPDALEMARSKSVEFAKKGMRKVAIASRRKVFDFTRRRNDLRT